MSESSPSSNVTEQTSAVQIYWRLLGYVKPYWHLFAFSILGLLVFAGSMPVLVDITGYMVDAIGAPSDNEDFWIPLHDKYLIPLGFITVFFFRGIASFVGNYFINRVAQSVVHDLRVELFQKLTTLPGRFFDGNNSGHLISRITYDVTGVTAAATDALKVVIRDGATIIFFLAYLLYLNWQLTLVFFVVAPVIGAVVNFVGKRLRKLSTKVQGAMGGITHVSSEMISGYKEMRSFGGEDYENKRFFDASYENFRQNMKVVVTSALNTPTVQFILSIAMGVLVFLVFTFMGDSTPGEFVKYIGAAGALPKPLRQVSEVIATIQKGVAAATSVFMQLDEKPEVDKGQFVSERVRGELELKELNFTYNSDEGNVLHDLNLRVQPGQSVALVGQSGSGKTTLTSLIPRFYDYEQGQILLDGTDIRDYKLANLRQQIAIVSQNITLFNDTVANNIAYGELASCSREQVEAAAKAANAFDFIKDMPNGFDTMIGEDGARLSGGQRQRLAIARALLKDAPILILDEATSALDTESERKIQSALEEVMKNRTTFVVAHRLSTIEKVDSIVVMEKGRIIEQGNHTELIAKEGAYAKLHQMQFNDN